MAARLTTAGIRWLLELLAPVREGKAKGKRAQAAVSGAAEALEALLPSSPVGVDPRQFALRLRVLDERGYPTPTVPKAGPVWETDFFRCTHFGNCLTEVRHCMERQGARWPGGNRLKSGAVREKKAAIHPYCASGRCEQGTDLRERCTFRPEDVWSKGRYRFYREDTLDQRKAMKAYDAERPASERAELTPFEEAAALTPDDPVTT